MQSKKNFEKSQNDTLEFNSFYNSTFVQCSVVRMSFNLVRGTDESLSEALLFAEHGENMLCTEIVYDIQSNFCTQLALPMFCKKKSF